MAPRSTTDAPTAYQTALLEAAAARAAQKAITPQQTAVQMAAAAVVAAAVVARAADVQAQRRAVQPLGRMIVDAGHALGIAAQRGGLARAGGHRQRARLPVAGDAVAVTPGMDQRQRLQRHRPQAACIGQAELGLDLVHAAGQTAQRLAAVAPRGRPAELLRLQQHHLPATLRQLQRGRQSGQAAADDRHLGADLALQRAVVLSA